MTDSSTTKIPEVWVSPKLKSPLQDSYKTFLAKKLVIVLARRTCSPEILQYIKRIYHISYSLTPYLEVQALDT